MSEWRYDVAEVGDEPDRLERGSPSPENVLFVLLGAATTVAVLLLLVYG